MKRSKKLIVAVVVAMVLIFAMSATAFAAAPVVSVDNSSPASGDTVKFTVKMGAGDVAMAGSVTASSNLTFVSVSNTNIANVDEGTFMLADLLDTEIVYTYTVSGNAGDAFSFTLSNVESSTDGINSVPYDGSVSATGAIAATVVDENPEQQQPVVPEDPAPTPPAEDKKDTLPDNGDASQDMLVWSVIAAAVLGAVGFTAYRKAFSK